MSKNILRRYERKNFTHIHNTIIDDERLSYRAKGVALVLLSKPDDWEIRIDYIVKMGTEGRDAVRKALNELATLGYMKRVRESRGPGSLTTVTMIADYPAFQEDGTPKSRISGYVESDSDCRPTEKPHVEGYRPTEKSNVEKLEGRETRRSTNQSVITNTDLTHTQDTNTQPTHTQGGVGGETLVGAAAQQNSQNKNGGGGDAAEDFLATLVAAGYGESVEKLESIAGREMAKNEEHFFWTVQRENADPSFVATLVDSLVQDWEEVTHKGDTGNLLMKRYRHRRGQTAKPSRQPAGATSRNAYLPDYEAIYR